MRDPLRAVLPAKRWVKGRNTGRAGARGSGPRQASGSRPEVVGDIL